MIRDEPPCPCPPHPDPWWRVAIVSLAVAAVVPAISQLGEWLRERAKHRRENKE